jgi:DNA polymerase-3 subunit beta
MEIICSQHELEKTISTVQRAVAVKSSIPTLEGILIKAQSEKILLCGYNLEIGITTTITEQILVDGSVVLPAKIFADIIRKLSPQEDITIKTNKNLVTTIKSGKSKFSIVGMTAEEYPSLPKVEKAQALKLPSATLKSMIKQTIFAVADINPNPVHTGALFEIQDGEIRLVAVDGYRLAMRTEKISAEESLKFIVPGRALHEILKLLPESEDEIDISVGQNHIMFKLNEYNLISRLLEGLFLNYRANIPEASSTEVVISTSEFTESIERVSLIITDRVRSPVRFIFLENLVKISCNTSLGQASDEIPTQISGENLEIGFNNRFLLDALKNTESDEVKIQMNGTLNPMKISPKDGNSFLFLVLPVRLKSDEEE